MRITAIEIENFKGIGERIRVELAPITLLFGANSSGKSTILQALLWVHDVINQGRPPNSAPVLAPEHDLGGFLQVVHRHDPERTILVRLEMDLSGHAEEMPEYLPGYADFEDIDDPTVALLISRLAHDVNSELNTAAIELSVAWDERRAYAAVHRYAVDINGEPFGVITSSINENETAITWLNFEHGLFKSSEHEAWFRDVGYAYPPEEGNPRNEFEELLRQLVKDGEDHAGTSTIHIPLSSFYSRLALPYPGSQLIGLKLQGRPTDFPDAPPVREMVKGMLSQGFVCPLDMAVRTLRLRYLGPLRMLPPRDQLNPVGLIPEPDESMWANGYAAWEELFRMDLDEDGELDVINDWLSAPDTLNSGYEVSIRWVREVDAGRIQDALEDQNTTLETLSNLIDSYPERRRLELVEKTTGMPVTLKDVGVGVSQVLPVVVAAFLPHDGLVMIEQPELHIHPAMQVALGDLFIEGAMFKDINFLIETHSEHLLLRILRRIRETKAGELPDRAVSFKAEDLAVIYVEATDMGTHVKRLIVDETGEFTDRWPKGFFDERAGELF